MSGGFCAQVWLFVKGYATEELLMSCVYTCMFEKGYRRDQSFKSNMVGCLEQQGYPFFLDHHSNAAASTLCQDCRLNGTPALLPRWSPQPHTVE